MPLIPLLSQRTSAQLYTVTIKAQHQSTPPKESTAHSRKEAGGQKRQANLSLKFPFLSFDDEADIE